jgi:6-pyruvoyltetrahydropterin/6-carboxytetrahydropterin synthase
MDVLDHRHLNKEVAEFAAEIPTTENIAVWIWRRLEKKIVKARLHRVRLFEQQDLFVDCYGE